MTPLRLCFVCLGNICRSPTAEAVMAHHVARAGLAQRILVDSAGTGGWHVGEPPDGRAAAEARRRGIAMESTARQFHPEDFARFDLILAMDRDNLREIARLAPDDDAREKVRLLRSFDPGARGDLAVPDPYFGGPEGFADVFELVDAACRGLLDHLRDGPLAR
jgi:protein-tyrosine phosphatase